ncbi:IspD/TarI family cytidylyltransferase [Amycolatopsis sp. H20-H5]|uniref:IspD/TarI family cytidylyltransferase n=1 Tax=Amycolatopsis sp. H20-H5 TaxID=3046309 RepID=UPI002DBB3DA3|nr:2-C-methyl-D-erythritol 4-phosphate cytidylyltransferase [Amycolatopsis sp. H20-H5]MEC3982474.1 2-C-methyl-D-erythritol 4-phosphate cytidylyltransferase [Amycolatopsis sp. H20-H5]
MYTTVAFVTAAHRGTDEELALSPVHGEALLTHTVRGLLRSPGVELVIVAAPERYAEPFRLALNGLARCRVVTGPSLRRVFAAVEPPNPVVLVHDLLRAFTPPETVTAVIDAVIAGAPVVVPVLPMADTVKVTGADNVILGTADRTGLRTAQSPLGFSREAFLTLDEPDLAAAVGAGAHPVTGHPDALRVATPFELTLAEAIRAAAPAEETL